MRHSSTSFDLGACGKWFEKFQLFDCAWWAFAMYECHNYSDSKSNLLRPFIAERNRLLLESKVSFFCVARLRRLPLPFMATEIVCKRQHFLFRLPLPTGLFFLFGFDRQQRRFFIPSPFILFPPFSRASPSALLNARFLASCGSTPARTSSP